MPRVFRSSLPDGYFHVFARGVDGCAIFLTVEDRRRFLTLVSACSVVHRWRFHALCLMTTHYHFVLDCTRPDLSRGMQRLNGIYAQWFNRRHVRFGPLFAGRFTSRAIAHERYLVRVCRYVVENPVRAGLCESVGDWPWAHSRYAGAAPDARSYGPDLRATYQPISIS